MKRIVCLMLVVALMLLTGCNNKKPASSGNVGSDSNNASSTITENNDASSNDVSTNDASSVDTENTDSSSVDSSTITENNDVSSNDSPSVDTEDTDDSESNIESGSPVIPTRREDRASLQTSSEEETTTPVRPGYAFEDAPAFEKVKFGKYKYIWGDEFDGNTLDMNKWAYGTDGGKSTRSYVTLMTEEDDPSIVGVRDGQLQLNSRRYTSLTNPQVQLVEPYTINTRTTMNFKYGYLEMRAKVPHSHGVVSAFWLKNENIALVTPKQTDYFVEVDIFETWCSATQVDPGLHKWYRKNTGNYFHTQPSQGEPGYGKYFFPDDINIRDEYHIYAMEWTPEFIKYYIDGEVWCTYDIVKEFDKNYEFDSDGKKLPEGLGDMSGFHDYCYPIISMPFNIDPQNSYRPNVHLTDDTELPFEFWIDYVRLYQDPSVDSGLVTKK